MVEILDLLLFKGNTPERTCPINTGDQPANMYNKYRISSLLLNESSNFLDGIAEQHFGF
jgi:hypothetical protein